jgi:hypothetical protein
MEEKTKTHFTIDNSRPKQSRFHNATHPKNYIQILFRHIRQVRALILRCEGEAGRKIALDCPVSF